MVNGYQGGRKEFNMDGECHNCDANVEDDMDYCPRCGAPL
jgi:rRNA maturation endonuclease Nob1